MDIDFSGTTSTACNNPIKPLTKEMLNEAMEAMKRDMIAYRPRFNYNRLSAGQMTGFNSTVFSRIHTT